jgi:L-lysine 2,3-aminomutase
MTKTVKENRENIAKITKMKNEENDQIEKLKQIISSLNTNIPSNMLNLISPNNSHSNLDFEPLSALNLYHQNRIEKLTEELMKKR